MPVIGLIAVLVIAVFAVAWLAADTQDRQAVSAMRHTVGSIVDGNRRELGGWTADYAYWDAFVEHVVVEPDPVWIEGNVGLYARENLAVDVTLVIDGSNEPYVISAAEDLDVEGDLLTLPPALVDLARAARGGAGPLEMRPEPQQTYIRLDDTVFMAAAAVAKWESKPDLPARKGGPVVLMYLRQIDETMLAQFGADYMINGLTLAPAFDPKGAAFDLIGMDGRSVAQLAWINPTPGTEFLRSLRIPMVVILAIAALFLAWIFVRLRAVFRKFVANQEALIQRTEALRIARDEADRANRAKTEFLAQMSHDLRTPLNAILGFSEVIALQTFGSDAAAAVRYRDYARQIHTGGDHLRSLIDSILDVARLDAGRYELRSETVSLDEAIETCLSLLKDTLEAKALKITAPSSGLSVWADPNALEQILLNLVGNAVKYTQAGGAIAIGASRTPSGIAVAISDTGRGMSQADVASAFELFSRGGAGPGTTTEGAGIGLSIVKRLIDLHEGTVRIDSAPNLGTTVTFVLPERLALPEGA
ncbi:sensor histidine kinase [Thalassobaculum salexigens]|uniref:sensor histidine kinase n=1 Tax=Thalassobaculum salexigens TaxID=455360 RepID=UPI0004175E85|nr:ATP-binding protein [Thalassobaculum salexigens]